MVGAGSLRTEQSVPRAGEACAKTDRVAAAGVLALILLSTAWMALTLRDGHSWYDDFAQYVMQAVNTARAEPFAATRYVYDPDLTNVSPRLYPPIFPLLLAPAYGVYGIDITVFKLLCVGCFAAGLLVTWSLFRRHLTRFGGLQYAAIMGFSPAFWELKDYIYSEHLFVPLFYASILLMDAWYVRRAVFVNPAVHAFCLGLLMYLSFGTRTVGIVLIPTLVMCELIRMSLHRPDASVGTFLASARVPHPSLVGVGALLLAVCLCVVQSLAMPEAGSGYLDQLMQLSPADVLGNLRATSTSFSLIWENGRDEWIRRIGGAVLIALAGVGYLRSNMPRLTPLGIASAVYFLAVLFWSGFSWLRIVWPILPAFVFYLIVGSDLVSRRVRHAAIVPAGVMVFTAGSYLSFYSGADFGPIADRIDSQADKEMYAFVAAEVDESQAVLFWKPRGLALYSNRRASKFPTRSPDAVVRRAKDIDAPLLVVRNDPNASETIVARQVPGLRQVFANTRYVAYRFSTER